MSIFDFLLGRRKDDTTQSQQRTTVRDQSQSSAKSSSKSEVKAGETTRGQSGSTTQQLFTPEQQGLLAELLGLSADTATQGANSARQAEIAGFLQTNLQNGINADTISENAQRAAVAEFEQRVAPDLRTAAQAVGSEDNTVSALLRAREGSLLAEKLAGIDSETRLAVEGLLNQRGAVATEAGQAATAGRQSELQGLLQALQLAKGGTSELSTTQLLTEDVFNNNVTNTKSQAEDLISLLEELSGNASGDSTRGSSILDFLAFIPSAGSRSTPA